MRTLTRSVLIGILIISCGDNITGPDPTLQPDYCGTNVADTVFTLYPDSLHLVVGSADRMWLQRGFECGSYFQQIPYETAPEVNWIIRDSSIATIVDGTPLDVPDDPGREVWPQAPGRTWVVMETAGFTDSLVVVVPDTVVMGRVTHISAGGDASCAVSDGDIALCWGDGSGSLLGRRGVDPAVGTCWGTPCSPMPVPRNTDAHYIQVNFSLACTLDAFGSAWCWGEGGGQLRIGVSPELIAYPIEVPGGVTFTTLTIGARHTCGLTSDGAAYCWGDNKYGRLGGDQRNEPSYAPDPVAGDLLWVSLDAREETTCGVADAGHLYCWGILANSPGMPGGAEVCEESLGKGGTLFRACSYVPLRMHLGTDTTADSLFVQVSGRCARTSLGSVFCYDDSSKVFSPVAGFGPFTAISGGYGHTCGLTTAGAAWCRGPHAVESFAVTGGHTFAQIAAGNAHTCGLTVEGEVWCWGRNDLGQAGTSISSRPSEVPVKVHGQD